MSSASSDKISDYINKIEEDIQSCSQDINKLLDSRAQIDSLCTSVSSYLRNVINGITTIEKLEDQATVLIKSFSELLSFTEKYPQEIKNSFNTLQLRVQIYQSSIEDLNDLRKEIKEIEKEQRKIMDQLELGNSKVKKTKKTRRKPGQRPESLKTERISLLNIEEEDGEIALEDI